MAAIEAIRPRVERISEEEVLLWGRFVESEKESISEITESVVKLVAD
jgi:hypothetical protein